MFMRLFVSETYYSDGDVTNKYEQLFSGNGEIDCP